MTLEQTLETVAKIQKAWDALALSISDAAEAFAKMWEEGFSLIFGPDGSLSRRKSTACLCSKSVRTRRFRLIITTPLPLETGLTSGVPIENEAGYF